MEEKITITHEGFQNYTGIINHVGDKISKIIEDVKPVSIETNVKVGAFLQDSDKAISAPIINKVVRCDKPFKILSFDGVDVLANPHMKWNDCTLKFMNEANEIIYKLVIEDSNNYMM